MRILLLNASEHKGGAARAAYRLHKGLRQAGLDSQLYVQDKVSDDETVIIKSQLTKLFGKLRPYFDSIPNYIFRKSSLLPFSNGYVSENIHSVINKVEPDIVHLHWINQGFASIKTLKKIKKPIVWTLHDSWVFTGGCHIPMSCEKYTQRCGSCVLFKSGFSWDLSRIEWLRKKKHWKNLDFTFVTPSRWLAENLRTSSLFYDRDVSVIPNGIDLNVYKPIDKDLARKILQLPLDNKILLFGAMFAASDENKGYGLLLEALDHLSEQIANYEKYTLLVFGATGAQKSINGKIDMKYMGHLYDDVSLSLLYSAADLLVSPSKLENLSNVIMESLACGLPCVAFNAGGTPDLIDHMKNGYLAKPYDTKDLATGLKWVLDRDVSSNVLSTAARQKAEDCYDIKKISQKYLELYKEVRK